SPVEPRINWIDEVGPTVLQVGDHHHADDARDQLNPAVDGNGRARRVCLVCHAMGSLTQTFSADFHKYGGIRPAMHPASLHSSSVKYSRYSPSSRLAMRAPRRPRCLTVFMKGSTKR